MSWFLFEISQQEGGFRSEPKWLTLDELLTSHTFRELHGHCENEHLMFDNNSTHFLFLLVWRRTATKRRYHCLALSNGTILRWHRAITGWRSLQRTLGTHSDHTLTGWQAGHSAIFVIRALVLSIYSVELIKFSSFSKIGKFSKFYRIASWKNKV